MQQLERSVEALTAQLRDRDLALSKAESEVRRANRSLLTLELDNSVYFKELQLCQEKITRLRSQVVRRFHLCHLSSP